MKTESEPALSSVKELSQSFANADIIINVCAKMNAKSEPLSVNTHPEVEEPITSADLAYSPTPSLQITRVLDRIEGQGSLKVLLADRFLPLRTHKIYDRIWKADLAHQSIEKNFKRGIAGDQHSVSSGSLLDQPANRPSDSSFIRANSSFFKAMESVFQRLLDSIEEHGNEESSVASCNPIKTIAVSQLF